MMWQSMTADEKRAYLDAELAEAKASGVSTKTMDDLWAEALKQAKPARQNAL